MKFGGQDNVLAVKVDNTIEYKEEASGTPFEWKFSNSNPNFGGLNRDVWLHIMGKVYQTLPLYENLQTTGVYVYGTSYDMKTSPPPSTSRPQVRNETAAAAALALSAAVVDADGVARAQFAGASQNVAAGQTADPHGRRPACRRAFLGRERPLPLRRLFHPLGQRQSGRRVQDSHRLPQGRIQGRRGHGRGVAQ